MAAAEGLLDEAAQPGVLRGLAVQDGVGVQPVEGLPRGVRLAGREDSPERPLAQHLAAGGVARRHPRAESAVPGDGRHGPQRGEVGVGVRDDLGAAEVEQGGRVDVPPAGHDPTASTSVPPVTTPPAGAR